MQLKRTLFGAIIAAALTFGSVSAGAAGINDIDKSSDYARQAISNLAGKDIISGDSNGNFNPLNNVKRSEMVKMIVKALGMDTSVIPQVPTFKDVPAGNWAFPYVEAAYKAGIIKGTGPETFGANNNCTREEAAAMFVRALGIKDEDIAGKLGSEDLNSLGDAGKVSPWAKDYVEFVLQSGLMNGTGSGNFEPLGSAERQQIAVITDRYLANMDKISQLSKLYTGVGNPELFRALWNNFYSYKGGIESTINTAVTQTVDNETTDTGLNMTAKGFVDKDNGDLQISMDTLSNGEKILSQAFRFIKINGLYYVKLDGTDNWQVSPAAGVDTQVTSSGRFLNYYDGMTVTNEGSVNLDDGTTATKYKLVLNDEALKVLLPTMLPGLVQGEGSLADVYNNGYDITAEIYLNSNNQIVLEKYNFTGRVKNEQNATDTVISSIFSTKYYDIGTDVKIEAPVIDNQGGQAAS